MDVSFRSRLAMIAAGLLLAANIVVPLVWGDLYPFTSAPMFRDRPTQYCNYRILDPHGGELPAEDWLVQRVYDGNPVGYGVGIRPPAVIEQEFGSVHDKAAIRRHIERQFHQPQNRKFPYVEVDQELIGPIDGKRVGITRTTRLRIAASGSK